MINEFDYNILYSGSKGNSATIYSKGGGWKMMVDAGKSYKNLESHLFDTQFLFYTHRHS